MASGFGWTSGGGPVAGFNRGRPHNGQRGKVLQRLVRVLLGPYSLPIEQSWDQTPWGRIAFQRVIDVSADSLRMFQPKESRISARDVKFELVPIFE